MEATKVIASMSYGHYLGALKKLQYKFTISLCGALYQGDAIGAHAHLKTKHTGQIQFPSNSSSLRI